MRFAFTFPMIQHPSNPELVSGTGVAAVARAAEDAGFNGVGFTDHPAPSQRWLDAGGHDSLDPFVALGFAAACTTALQLIPNIVVLPYRNPFIVAKAAASLDVLSGGRFVLAVGTGYLKAEFAAVGVEHSERAVLLDEALTVIRDIWTRDDVTFAGRHFDARGITAQPRPVSAPHPPIWVGGNSGAARQRVTDHGNGWCPFPAAPQVAATAGTTPLATAADLGPLIADLRRRLTQAGRTDPVDIAFSNGAGGSPGADQFNALEHLEGLAELASIGVTWVQVSMPGDSLQGTVEAIERYGKEIIAPWRQTHGR